jgi:hypothetical protein
MPTLNRLSRAAALAAALLLPAGAALADTITDTPIWLENVTFSDGTTLTGEFSLDVYDYLNNAYFADTSAGQALDGTAIGAYNFVSGTDGAGSSGQPATYLVYFDAANTPAEIILTFAHALTIPGPDPLLLDGGFTATPQSAECYGYSCTLSDERLITGGIAVVPEPASYALLTASLLTLLWAGRRAAGVK